MGQAAWIEQPDDAEALSPDDIVAIFLSPVGSPLARFEPHAFAELRARVASPVKDVQDEAVRIILQTVWVLAQSCGRKYGLSKHDLEDIKQTVAAKACRELDRFDPVRGRLGPWLYAFIKHGCLNHRRQTRGFGRLAEKDEIEAVPDRRDGGPADDLTPLGEKLAALIETHLGGPADDLTSLVEKLAALIETRLNEKENRVFFCWLNYKGENFARDCATELGLKPGHVRVLLHRAKQKLKGWLCPPDES